MPGYEDTLQKDMVPGELFPTLHWMTWRMDAWMHGTFESCSYANMQSFIPLFHHSRCDRSEPNSHPFPH